MNRSAIIEYFNTLCGTCNKKLSRSEYRMLNPEYPSSLIEKLWGNWNNFMDEVNDTVIMTRTSLKKKFNKKADKIVISYVNDGTDINLDFFKTLKLYCKNNHAELGILWGKGIKKNVTFSRDTFDLLSEYLATEFTFEKDDKCIAKDFMLPLSQKNPLLNIDKLSTNINTVIVGSNKQYLKILPYKQYHDYRIACSTGGLSEIEYGDTISNCIDEKYHTFGAILLEWSKDKNRYIIRNLIFKNGCIHDLNKIYYNNKITTKKSLPGMVLGDLHLPDEDEKALSITEEFINKYKPEAVMLHDIASWNSVCHHNFGKCLTQVINMDEINTTLETELNDVLIRLRVFAKMCPDSNFYVVNSNHDNFIEKWLETGEFLKDKRNAKIGAKLFLDYSQGKNIFDGKLPENMKFLPKNKSFEICGFELSEHGDCGISGAGGSANAFNKTFENCIVGHTHSPEIREKTFYVGTLSKLIVNYNQKGMTTWVNANAVVHENGTAQLILI